MVGDLEPSDGGYWGCKEQQLCTELPEASGKGFLVFKTEKETPVIDLAPRIEAPGFIMAEQLAVLCPCSCDMWVVPEICPGPKPGPEEYNHLVAAWEAYQELGAPNVRMTPPHGLIEYQTKVLNKEKHQGQVQRSSSQRRTPTLAPL
jgi:hypothetical protein